MANEEKLFRLLDEIVLLTRTGNFTLNKNQKNRVRNIMSSLLNLPNKPSFLPVEKEIFTKCIYCKKKFKNEFIKSHLITCPSKPKPKKKKFRMPGARIKPTPMGGQPGYKLK